MQICIYIVDVNLKRNFDGAKSLKALLQIRITQCSCRRHQWAWRICMICIPISSKGSHMKLWQDTFTSFYTVIFYIIILTFLKMCMGKSQIWPRVIDKLSHMSWCFLKIEGGIRNLYNISRFSVEVSSKEPKRIGVSHPQLITETYPVSKMLRLFRIPDNWQSP
jgi:hypothetical protein